MQPSNPKPATMSPDSASKPSLPKGAKPVSRFPSARAAAKHYLKVLDQARASEAQASSATIPAQR